MSNRLRVLALMLTLCAVLIAACRADAPAAVSLPPTWTPTAAVALVSDQITVSAPTLPPPPRIAAPTQEPAPTVEPATLPPPTIIVHTPTPPPLDTSRRIDAVGPIALATIAPLAIGMGEPPVRLVIPALHLDAPVEPMGWTVVEDADGVRSEWEVVDNAAGHHINSAFAGETGNVVISGHNNIGGSVFRSVCVIGEPGVDFGLEDEMILFDGRGRQFTYRVNGWQRIPERNASIARRQENAAYMAPTNDARLTLITCWPPNGNSHRVVVTGLLTAMQ